MTSEQGQILDVENPGDASDINLEGQGQQMEQLNKLLEALKKMNPDDRKEFLKMMAEKNAINPKDKGFSTVSEKGYESLKDRMRARLVSMKNGRAAKKPKPADTTAKPTQQTRPLTASQRRRMMREAARKRTTETESDTSETTPPDVSDTTPPEVAG